MVDTSRRIDLSGNDVIVNSIGFAPGIAQQGNIVVDLNGTAPTLITTSATLTAAQMAAGMACYTGGAGTITFDSAANIVAFFNSKFSGAQIGNTIEFDVTCAATAPTIALGSGNIAASGVTTSLVANTQRTYLIQITNVATPACTVYS
jgi:hypothetical protein